MFYEKGKRKSCPLLLSRKTASYFNASLTFRQKNTLPFGNRVVTLHTRYHVFSLSFASSLSLSLSIYLSLSFYLSLSLFLSIFILVCILSLTVKTFQSNFGNNWIKNGLLDKVRKILVSFVNKTSNDKIWQNSFQIIT